MMGQQQQETVAGHKTVIAKTRLRTATLAALAATVLAANSLALTRPAEAQIQVDPSFPTMSKIAFMSDRTTGQGVDNPEGDNEIFTMNTDGSGLKQLTKNALEDKDPTFSPDGKKIAYTGDDGSNDEEIYLINAADGSGKQKLTSTANTVQDSEATFSPDGTKIAYRSHGTQNSNPDGYADVFLMNAADGSGKQNLTNSSDLWNRMPDFSPDGQKIAYVSWGSQASNPNGDDDIYVMNKDGSGKQNLTNMPNDQNVDDLDPNYSPKTQKIAYSSSGVQSLNTQGDADVFLMNAADGSGKQNLTNNYRPDDGQPSFSPSGSQIAYSSMGGDTSNYDEDYDADIYVMGADGSNKKDITQQFGANQPWDFNPDWYSGKLIVSDLPTSKSQPADSSKEQQQEQTNEQQKEEAKKTADSSKGS